MLVTDIGALLVATAVTVACKVKKRLTQINDGNNSFI